MRHRHRQVTCIRWPLPPPCGLHTHALLDEHHEHGSERDVRCVDRRSLSAVLFSIWGACRRQQRTCIHGSRGDYARCQHSGRSERSFVVRAGSDRAPRAGMTPRPHVPCSTHLLPPPQRSMEPDDCRTVFMCRCPRPAARRSRRRCRVQMKKIAERSNISDPCAYCQE